MKSYIGAMFLAIVAFAAFSIGAPAYGQEGCTVITPDEDSGLVNTNGNSGGSGECSSLGMEFGCEVSLSGDGEASCTGTANGTSFRADCTKVNGIVDCTLDSADVEATGRIDGFVAENISGGQNTQITFRFDVPQVAALCTNAQGKPSGNVYNICLDGVEENPQVAVPGKLTECTVDAAGGTNVNGVDVICPLDTAPEQVHIVVASAEFECDPVTQVCEPALDHGLLTADGVFNPEAVCVCFGSSYDTAEKKAEFLDPCKARDDEGGGLVELLPQCTAGGDSRQSILLEFGSFRILDSARNYGP